MFLPPVALALVLVALPLATTAAQDRPPGQVAARAFAAPPAPLSFQIEPGDNTDENIALAERIARDAGARGMGVAPGAAIVLRFDTEVRSNVQAARPSFSRPGGGSADQDSGAPSKLGPGDEVTNMLSTGGGGLIGGRPPSGSGYGRPLRYVINAMLEDRATGRRLWQGHVSYDSTSPDRTATFVSLAPVLVEQIGKNVPERAFRLD